MAGAAIFWLLFAVALLVVAYFVFALLYHWLRYGFMYPMVWIMLPIWAIGTGILFLISVAAVSAL